MLRCVAGKPGTMIPDNVFGSVFRDQCFEDCGAAAREGRCSSCPRAPVNATTLHIIEKSLLHLQGPSA